MVLPPRKPLLDLFWNLQPHIQYVGVTLYVSRYRNETVVCKYHIQYYVYFIVKYLPSISLILDKCVCLLIKNKKIRCVVFNFTFSPKYLYLYQTNPVSICLFLNHAVAHRNRNREEQTEGRKRAGVKKKNITDRQINNIRESGGITGRSFCCVDFK